MNKTYVAVISTVVIAALPITGLLNSNLPARAQSCVKLREVTTGQTSISKRISARALGENNWNTDFAVPTGTTFSYFIANVWPENNATYQITISLKYNDNTSSQAFRDSIPLQRHNLFSKRFWAPTAKQPFQINMNVGGQLNDAYAVSVQACR